MYYLERFHVDSRPDVDLFSVDFYLGLVYDYYLSLYLSRFEKLRENMIQDIVLQPRTIRPRNALPSGTTVPTGTGMLQALSPPSVSSHDKVFLYRVLSLYHVAEHS